MTDASRPREEDRRACGRPGPADGEEDAAASGGTVPPPPLDLVPLLGLAPRSHVRVVGGAAGLEADLRAAGHQVLTSSGRWDDPRAAGVPFVGRAGRVEADGVLDEMGPQGVLVVLGPRARVVAWRACLRRAGMQDLNLLALDDAARPALAVTLHGAGPSRVLVRRLRQPWTRKDVVRRAGDSLLALTPAYRRLLPDAVLVARRD